MSLEIIILKNVVCMNKLPETVGIPLFDKGVKPTEVEVKYIGNIEILKFPPWGWFYFLHLCNGFNQEGKG